MYYKERANINLNEHPDVAKSQASVLKYELNLNQQRRCYK